MKGENGKVFAFFVFGRLVLFAGGLPSLGGEPLAFSPVARGRFFFSPSARGRFFTASPWSVGLSGGEALAFYAAFAAWGLFYGVSRRAGFASLFLGGVEKKRGF